MSLLLARAFACTRALARPPHRRHIPRSLTPIQMLERCPTQPNGHHKTQAKIHSLLLYMMMDWLRLTDSVLQQVESKPHSEVVTSVRGQTFLTATAHWNGKTAEFSTFPAVFVDLVHGSSFRPQWGVDAPGVVIKSHWFFAIRNNWITPSLSLL